MLRPPPRYVFSSRAEIASVFTNAKNAEMLRQIIIKMGHPQPPTPTQTDNTAVPDIITNSVKQRKTQAMDMLLYKLHDQHFQNKYHFIRAPKNGPLLYKAPSARASQEALPRHPQSSWQNCSKCRVRVY